MAFRGAEDQCVAIDRREGGSMSGRLRSVGVTMLAAAMVLGAFTVSASASVGSDQLHKPKMRISMASEIFESGSDVTGSVNLSSKHKGGPLAGAVLDVQVDGSDVAQVTTDGDGNAPFDIAGVADGEHVLTVIFGGDEGHRATQKDRDFSVGCDEDCGGE
jgi:hypothetical protein